MGRATNDMFVSATSAFTSPPVNAPRRYSAGVFDASRDRTHLIVRALEPGEYAVLPEVDRDAAAAISAAAAAAAAAAAQKGKGGKNGAAAAAGSGGPVAGGGAAAAATGKSGTSAAAAAAAGKAGAAGDEDLPALLHAKASSGAAAAAAASATLAAEAAAAAEKVKGATHVGPLMLKVKDWPPTNDFGGEMPRHYVVSEMGGGGRRAIFCRTT